MSDLHVPRIEDLHANAKEFILSRAAEDIDNTIKAPPDKYIVHVVALGARRFLQVTYKVTDWDGARDNLPS